MITFSQSADIALRSLMPEKQEKLIQSIQQLEKFPQDSTLRDKVFKVEGGTRDHLYTLKAPLQMRVLFQSVGDRKEILEIVPYARLQYMYGSSSP